MNPVHVFRRFFNGSYYYLDEPTKSSPPALSTDWENETGGDGAYGPVAVHDFAQVTFPLPPKSTSRGKWI